MNELTTSFNADLAKTDPKEDELGFAPVAVNIAKGICRMTPTTGITIGIIGKWGAGKSTMVNFISHQIKRSAPEIVQIPFNPWWFSSRDDLVLKLLEAISKKCTKGTKEEKDLSKLLLDYAEAVTDTPVSWNPELFGVKLDMKKIAEAYLKRRSEQRSIPALKQEIGDLLREYGTKYLLVIDDIDRLTSTEIRELFRAVKAIADLPNVIYLMALDREVVSNALGEHFQNRGNDYLEKIIQVSLDLPTPSVDGISRIFADGLNSLLSSLGINDVDQERFWQLDRNGLRNMLLSPRDASRLSNVLRVTLPSVVEEVCIPDFIAIEAIRLFRPQLYDFIRLNKQMFAGASDSERFDSKRPNREFQSLIDKGPSWQKNLLIELFPKQQSYWGGAQVTSRWLEDWRKKQYVCSPDVFDVYFRFSLAPDTVPTSVVNMVVHEANSGQFSDTLKRLIESESVTDKNHLWSLLNRLQDYVSEDLTPQGCGSLVRHLLKIWKNYTHVEGTKIRSLFRPSNGTQLTMLLFLCVMRAPESDTVAAFSEAIKESSCPMNMMQLLRRTSQHTLSESGEKEVFSEENHKMLCKLMSNWIQAKTDRGKFEETDLWIASIRFIREFAPDLTHLILSKMKRNPYGVLAIISAGSAEVISSNKNTPRFEYRISEIEELINIEEASSALKDQDWVNARSAERVECFFKYLAAYQERERTPKTQDAV